MLDSNKVWAAKENDRSQWMVIDAGSEIFVSGLVVQGQDYGDYEEYVTSLSL
jgi:hypothetical protein